MVCVYIFSSVFFFCNFLQFFRLFFYMPLGAICTIGGYLHDLFFAQRVVMYVPSFNIFKYNIEYLERKVSPAEKGSGRINFILLSQSDRK